MTNLTKPQRRLITIASVLGILQGIAWIVMSIICIVEYLSSKNALDVPVDVTDSYMTSFNYLLYAFFLFGNSDSTAIINPHSFTVFMWIYLMTDSIWVVLSILQLRSINQTHSNPVNLLKCWGVITFLIACVDFLLVVLIGADYHDCMKYVPQQNICTNIQIPVLTIAAKGFVLWIVNVIFVYVIYRIIRTIQAGKNLHRNLLRADPQIPRATLQSSPNNWSNQNNWQNQSGPNDKNADFWSNTPRPVSYDGRTPPTNPAFYPTQQQQQSYPKY